MIPCTTTTVGSAISYCSKDSYGNAGIFRIGQVDPSITAALVVVENLATGRTSFHPATIAGGLLFIDFPEGLSPGQYYRVSVEVDGSEVLFRPYVSNEDTGVHSIGTVKVEAVHVNARKYVDDQGNVTSPAEQWLTI
jgi:hypothetical protein